MTSTRRPETQDASSTASPRAIAAALRDARRGFREDAQGALALARRCAGLAHAHGASVLESRATTLEGHVALHRGDVRGALGLALTAERQLAAAPPGRQVTVARAELAALRAQVSFYTGSYSDALADAEHAVELGDAAGELDLRIFVRRAAFVVYGNLNVRELGRRLHDLLELTRLAGDRWEQALTHNDIACYREGVGETEAARAEISRALELAESTSPNRFALAVIHSTRADIELRRGDARAALEAAERSLALLSQDEQPNPYLLGASVRAQVLARTGIGEYDSAQQAGERALSWLGERLPHTRSVILAAVAEALREAGRIEQAYEALSRSAQLEREAFQEISELQLNLERALAQADLARSQTSALAAKNRELARAHAQLAARTRQLEELQEQLRDQADRDWLTGVHNRRFLARELANPSLARRGTLLSVAIVDLDHFKRVNDRHGHAVGDRVLVRAAELLARVLREADTVVRSGGEEFLILMPRTDERAALRCCERIRGALAAEPWGEIAPGLSLTASVGVATSQDPDGLEALVNLADHRLYQAKRAGRDRIVAAG